MTELIDVHLIDDDRAVLESLSDFLESEGCRVHPHDNAQALLRVIEVAPRPTCIVSDVRMPGMSGLELQKELTRQGREIPLILITGHGDIAMAVGAIKAGAYDFLEKPFDEMRLYEAIVQAHEAASRRFSSEQELSDLLARRNDLSNRQREVMVLAAQGRTNKEIGQELGISPRTVEIYRARVMERMGAKTLADLVRIVLRLENAK